MDSRISQITWKEKYYLLSSVIWNKSNVLSIFFHQNQLYNQLMLQMKIRQYKYEDEDEKQADLWKITEILS